MMDSNDLRLYFLRRLRSFHVEQELYLFYNWVVQSVIINCLLCWWSSLGAALFQSKVKTNQNIVFKYLIFDICVL